MGPLVTAAFHSTLGVFGRCHSGLWYQLDSVGVFYGENFAGRLPWPLGSVVLYLPQLLSTFNFAPVVAMFIGLAALHADTGLLAVGNA